MASPTRPPTGPASQETGPVHPLIILLAIVITAAVIILLLCYSIQGALP